MGLSSVLVDQARVLTNSAVLRHNPDGSTTRVRVEGETLMGWVYGPYFDCRVDSPAAPEATDAAGGRVRTAQHPSLIYELEDVNGDPVVLTADDKITVESEDFGTATFEITGQPVIYRKKQDTVCGVAALVQVLDFGVPDGPVSQVGDGGTTTITITPSGS